MPQGKVYLKQDPITWEDFTQNYNYHLWRSAAKAFGGGGALIPVLHPESTSEKELFIGCILPCAKAREIAGPELDERLYDAFWGTLAMTENPQEFSPTSKIHAKTSEDDSFQPFLDISEKLQSGKVQWAYIMAQNPRGFPAVFAIINKKQDISDIIGKKGMVLCVVSQDKSWLHEMFGYDTREEKRA